MQMKYTIQSIFILTFLQVCFFSTQAQNWEERKKNLTKKSLEEISTQSSAYKVEQLTKIITQDQEVLRKQTLKQLEINELFKVNKDAFGKNIREIRKNKLLLQEVRKINSLESQKKSLKSAWKKSLEKKNSHRSLVTKVLNNVKKNRSILTLLSKGGKIIANNEAVGAGGGTLGEVAAWWEGNSSFRNVVIRATKEGSKAAVSIGTGIIVGGITATNSLNPYFSGAAAVFSTVYMEEVFDETAGKYFDKLMDREHLAINKYKADPDKLFKIRAAKREKALKEQKKLMKDVMSKQDEYNAELKKYIDERNAMWAQFEEDVKKEVQHEYQIQSAENPRIVQKASRTKIKPGETVTITVETTGGLLPITYSGMLDYTVKTGYDRYLVSYKWTPDKKTEPGIYDFTIKATSHSKKTGSHTLGIEVIDPNPKPAAQSTAKHNTDTDGERVYSASELNIKEIPGAEIRKMIFKVNGIYYGHCQTPPDIKTQKFDIDLQISTDYQSKLGVAHLSMFAGSRTVTMSEEQKEAVLVKLREKGYLPHLPYPDYLDDFYKIYFHASTRDRKFDPVSGRIWGEIEGAYSTSSSYIPKFESKGYLEANLNNGIITGTIKLKIGKTNYTFPFTAKK